MLDFLKPIQQRQVSNFTPLPVNEALRSVSFLQDRQDNALDTIDQISEFEDQAQVLEQDKPLLNEILTGVRGQIDGIANEGYVGDRLRAIRKMSRDVQKKYQPFLAQRANFQKSQQALMEDETLTELDKQARLNSMQRGLGLKLNEQGEIDTSSIFQGRSFASRPDFDKLVSDQLKNMETQRRAGMPQQVGDQIISSAREFRDPNVIRGVARNVLFNNPESLAFIQDEVLLEKERIEASGGEFTSQDEQRVIDNLVERTVNTAVGTFTTDKRFVTSRNAPARSASTGEDLEFVGKLGNVVMSRNLSEIPGNVRGLETSIQEQRQALSQITDPSARLGAEAKLKALEAEYKNNQEFLNNIAEREGIDRDFLNNVKAAQPEVPPGIEPSVARQIREDVENSTGFLARLVNDTLNSDRIGFNVPFTNVNELASENKTDSSESEYYRQYRNWYSSMSAAQKQENKAFEKALGRYQENVFESTHSSGISFGETSNVPDLFKNYLNTTAENIGVEYLDINGETVSGNNLPSEITDIGLLSTAPTDAGNFRIHVRGKDANGDDQKYVVRFNPRENRSIFDHIGKQLIENADNSALGRQQKAAGYSMRFPEMSQELIDQAPTMARQSYGGLLNPDDFVTIDDNNNLIRTELYRNDDGTFVLRDSNTKQPLSNDTVYTGPEDVTYRLFVPLMEHKYSSANGAN